MSVVKHPVTFVNADGLRLFGIVHEPTGDARRDVAVLLLSPGVKNRVAPHRLYNKMSAALTDLGFWVARFDFHGLGDSEGTIDERFLADLYGSIQLGRYVRDTQTAMDWLSRTYRFKRFIVAGLCGGAITGLLAATNDPRIVGILSIGMPVILDGSNIDSKRYMTSGQLSGLRSAYLKKALDPGLWIRVFRLQTDFGLMARSFLAVFRKRGAAQSASAGAGTPPPADNANPHFGPAFLRYVASGRPVLMLFSGQDRLYWEFEEKFMAHHRDALARHSAFCDVQIVSEANHILTFPEWQTEMFQRTRAWLERWFPRSGQTPVLAQKRTPAVGHAGLQG